MSNKKNSFEKESDVIKESEFEKEGFENIGDLETEYFTDDNVRYDKNLSFEERRQKFVNIMNDYHSGNEKKKQQAIYMATRELEGFIRKIIQRKYSTYAKKYFRDLMQEGNIGIMVGMEVYDATKGMPTTFFYKYIIHEIQGFITATIDKTTPHYSTNIKKINKVIDEFNERGIKYTKTDIATQTGMTIETVEQSMAIRKRRDEVHIEACQTNIIDENILNDRFPTPEAAMMEKEEQELIDKVLNNYLTAEEIEVLELTFGIHGKTVISETDIAKMKEIPKDKVKRILNSAIKKLRNSELKLFFEDHLKSESKLLEEYEVPFANTEIANITASQLENVDDVDF